MGRPRIDLTGKKFGHLTVIRPAGSDKYCRALWLCQCDCGKTRVVDSRNLRRVENISCGCTIHRSSEPDKRKPKRLYSVWKSMKKRCYSSCDATYQLYGARGISVCDEWRNNYKAFEQWAYQNGYDENAKRGECTLDRIDNFGNYEPSNCRWVSNKEQSLNRRTNRPVEINGQKYFIDDLSKITGISRSGIVQRLNAGWSIQEALTKDLDKCKEVTEWQTSLENFGFSKSLINMSLKSL